MSFLLQTNEEYIKLQMRSLLQKPAQKRILKRKLKQVGLYNAKLGFGTYKNFIQTELNNRRSRSMNAKYSNSPFSSPSKLNSSLLPKLQLRSQKRMVGLVNTQFFNRNRLTVSCCVLFKLTSKINTLPGLAIDYKDQPTLNRDTSEIDSEFLMYYINFFHTVLKNITSVLNDGPMPLPGEISKLIGLTFNEMCKSSNSGAKKNKIGTKDLRLLGFFEQKPWGNIIADSVYKFFFKKYSFFGEKNFEDFVVNYLLTNNLTNMQKLCFEIYDRSNSQSIRSSDLFVFFESPFFPLIKNDLFVMINYLSNYKYSSERSKIKRKTTKYFQEITENKNKKISFRVFTKLKFEQKFPDMLLALLYIILGENSVKHFCIYYSIPKYKVALTPIISVSRPVNYCQNFYQTALEHYKILKLSYITRTSKAHDFKDSVFKGALISFILLCDCEAFCQYRMLAASPSSMTRGSEFLFSHKCPEIIKRWYFHMLIPNTQHISIQEYIDYIEGFFIVFSI